MNDWPTHSNYSTIGARYLTESLEPFFAKMDVNGQTMLDLCTGNGSLALMALTRGASYVEGVDSSGQMLDHISLKNLEPRFGFLELAVEDYLLHYRQRKFEVVTCRQGIHYWLHKVRSVDVAQCLKQGGMFVFNHYGTQPPARPTARFYFIRGRKYVEVNYCVNNILYETVMCEGFPPHVSQGVWTPPETLHQSLSPYFNIEQGEHNMWYCTKK